MLRTLLCSGTSMLVLLYVLQSTFIGNLYADSSSLYSIAGIILLRQYGLSLDLS